MLILKYKILLDEIDREVEEPKEEINEERDISEEAKDTILNNINDSDDVYVTYHIHEMKETDTVESICLKYNTSDSILGEYNDLSTLTLGDKIIIPEINE